MLGAARMGLMTSVAAGPPLAASGYLVGGGGAGAAGGGVGGGRPENHPGGGGGGGKVLPFSFDFAVGDTVVFTPGAGGASVGPVTGTGAGLAAGNPGVASILNVYGTQTIYLSAAPGLGGIAASTGNGGTSGSGKTGGTRGVSQAFGGTGGGDQGFGSDPTTDEEGNAIAGPNGAGLETEFGTLGGGGGAHNNTGPGLQGPEIGWGGEGSHITRTSGAGRQGGGFLKVPTGGVYTLFNVDKYTSGGFDRFYAITPTTSCTIIRTG